MNQHLAVGVGPSFQGLHRIARLKGLGLIEADKRITLGPAEDYELLSAILLWQKLRPDLTEQCSFTLHASSLQRELAPKGRVSWTGISKDSELAKRLDLQLNGEASWEELNQLRASRTPLLKPQPYFGRTTCEKRIFDLVERTNTIVMDAQPGMGRSTFAKGFAHSYGSHWVDGVNYIDFDPEAKSEKAEAILALSPWEIARDWRGQHQLIILDHVDGNAEWLAEVMSILERQGTLATYLIMPSSGSFPIKSGQTVLSPLDSESFNHYWQMTFGDCEASFQERMTSYTGRMPGVVAYMKAALGSQSVETIDLESHRTLARFPALLDQLGGRLNELDAETLTLLRHICSYSSQVSLSLVLQDSDSEAQVLSRVALLIEKGWLIVEEDGYRVPNPLIMAVRKILPNSREEWAASVSALIKEAQTLSKKGLDLAPTQNLSSFKRLLRTGYDALLWITQQEDQLELILDVVGLFWVSALTEGYSKEFLALTDRLYSALDDVPISSKTVLYWEARGRHMRTRGDMAASLEAHERGLREAVELGDQRGALWNLHFKAACLSLMARRQEADAAYEELIPQWRKHGTQKDIAFGLCTLCLHFFRYRQYDLMPDVLVEAFSFARKSDEVGLLSSVKELQGWLAHAERDYARSIELMDEAELLANQVKHARRDLIGLGRGLAYWLTGDRDGAIASLYRMMERPFPIEALSRLSLEIHLSQMELMHGNLEPGFARTKALSQQMIDYQARIWMGDLMDLNALAAWRLGHFSSAAILAGCGFHWHSLTNRGSLDIEKEVRFWIPDCREKLGESHFQARFHAGAKLDPDKLLALTRVDYALVSQMLPELFDSEASDKPLLSARQRDVVRLAGEGLSNKRIAEALFLEEGTVKRHLHNAAQELGVKGRVALVRKAMDLGLIP